MERDENYVPKTRTDKKLADDKVMKRQDYIVSLLFIPAGMSTSI